MRHIQLYLIICKKSYSGRVTYSLSWQKANTMTGKPLPKIWSCVTLCLHPDALGAGPWFCGSCFHPPPSGNSSRLNTVLPGQAAVTD